MTLTAAQITSQVAEVLQREPAAGVVAMHAEAPGAWPARLAVKGRPFEVRWCGSALAVREALAEHAEVGSGDGIIVLTPSLTHQLADDVVARLARARVFEPSGWDTVRQLFGTPEIDARLGRFGGWMPHLLAEGSRHGPYAPVVSGFLDLETAWREVLDRSLGLPAARPDAVALLRWTLQPAGPDALRALPPKAQEDMLAWLAASAGSIGPLLAACIRSGQAAQAVPLGLVCDVIFSPRAEGQPELGHAAIRLEAYVERLHVGVAEGRAWARAARDAVHSAQQTEALHACLARADGLLSELRIAPCAALSEVLPSALDERLRAFAQAVQAQLAQPAVATLHAVEAAADAVARHQLARERPLRLERVEMARRACRWLLQPLPGTSSVDALLAWQADEGAFLDWARFRLHGGDELPPLSQAYADLAAAVARRRRELEGGLAAALPEWNAHGCAGQRLVPVEDLLARVVAPILARHPVLLLVMDGLSCAVFRELFSQPEHLGWAEQVPAGAHAALVGVAALPTITAVSRASLLCGRLTSGTAAQERSGFASHAGLLGRSLKELPPRLFHKGDLSQAGGLAPDVRDALANPGQKVVGVVYNGVDDHLDGADQLHQSWSLEHLRLLLPLLHEARQARRALVVTADHGHVLEHGSRPVPNGDGSDRWRRAGAILADGEVLLQSGRVLAEGDAQQVVCLAAEALRYGARKNGYHGGASLQELAVPASLFLPLGLGLEGWEPAPPPWPEWWHVPAAPAPAATAPSQPAARPAGRRTARPVAAQPMLFDTEPAAAAAAGDWIARLLAGELYAAQKRLAARVALDDDTMRKLLQALDRRGGKLSRTALAQRLAVPELRMAGMVSAARRVLNVDQAEVLRLDEASGMVELDVPLLRRQFRAEDA